MSLIDCLLNLYRVDNQVRGLRQRLVAAERFLNAQQAKLAAFQQQRAELLTRRRHLQAKIDNAETEIAAIDERIGKFRSELNQAQTSKQYNALLSEINTFREQKSEIETSVLSELEEIESLNAELAELESRIEERGKHCQLAEKQLEERELDVGERLAELESERSVAAESVPGDHLRVFEELAESYDGEALAELEVIDRRNREYACGACHMHVPFESASVLMGSGDTLVRCTACRRILYLKEEARGAVAKK